MNSQTTVIIHNVLLMHAYNYISKEVIIFCESFKLVVQVLCSSYFALRTIKLVSKIAMFCTTFKFLLKTF